jgi:putative Mg2+ transporter-C (MgtC) family protein
MSLDLSTAAGAHDGAGSGVHGLTTAAMIWVNAAIGVAVGGGEYHVAIITTGVTLFVLILLNPVERWIDRKSPKSRKSGIPSDDDD